MNGCLFCNIQRGLVAAAGQPVYEDDLMYAFHTYPDPGEGPIYLGRIMLITRRHTPDFAALTPAEAQAVGALISRLSHALKVCAGAEKVYAVFYGEVTPHLHVILTSRYPNTPPDYLRWNALDWPDAPRGGPDEIAALNQRLRDSLASAH